MPEQLVIDVNALNKSYGDKRVVRDFSLKVKRGEIFGFLGPNGSGKTTSIRLICGLLKADSGNGTVLGFDVIKQSAAIKREVGYMTQRFSLWEDLTIRENLDFVGRMYGMSDRVIHVADALEKLGLSSRQDQLAGSLSGGWKQRLSLAACMLHQPRLLLLDEPTAGVDPKARRDFWDEIHRLAATGVTILVTTHYMDEAERCTRLGYIAYGRLLTTGTMQEVISQQHLATWIVRGSGLPALAEKLRVVPGVSQVTAFGNTLHVTGPDAAVLAESLRALNLGERHHMDESATALEDVFIHLMNQAEDNFQ